MCVYVVDVRARDVCVCLRRIRHVSLHVTCRVTSRVSRRCCTVNDETELKCDTRELLTKVPHIHSQMAERDFAELEVIIVERVRWPPATRASYASAYYVTSTAKRLATFCAFQGL